MPRLRPAFLACLSYRWLLVEPRCRGHQTRRKGRVSKNRIIETASQSQAGPDNPFPAAACEAAHLTPASAPTPFRGQAQANAALHGGVLPTRMSQKGRVTNGFACHTEPAPSHRSINPARREPGACRETPCFWSLLRFFSQVHLPSLPVAPIRTLSTPRDRDRYHPEQAFQQDARFKCASWPRRSPDRDDMQDVSQCHSRIRVLAARLEAGSPRSPCRPEPRGPSV